MGQKALKNFWSLAAAIGTFSILPFVALAENKVQTGLGSISTLFPGTGEGIAGSTTVSELIVNIITTLLMISGAIAVLFLIVGGFWYITSAGNEEQAEKGKTTVVNAIIGVIIIVLSYVIINVVSSFVATSN